jgi:hypothetical protein
MHVSATGDGDLGNMRRRRRCFGREREKRTCGRIGERQREDKKREHKKREEKEIEGRKG